MSALKSAPVSAVLAALLLVSMMFLNAQWVSSRTQMMQAAVNAISQDLQKLTTQQSKLVSDVQSFSPQMLQQIKGLQQSLLTVNSLLESTQQQQLKSSQQLGQLEAVVQQSTQQQQQQQQQQQHQTSTDVSTPPSQQQEVLARLAHVGLVNGGCTSRAKTGSISLPPTDQLVAPVVIVAYNRVHYLARAMVSVLKPWMDQPSYRKSFPLFVSIDGDDLPITQFALTFKDMAGVQVIRNDRTHGQCKPTDGHCHLAMHYLMVVQLFFECLKAPRLIFLEEDLEVAPDFFTYFEATAPIMDQDSSILCVSAWNDHGQAGRAENASALYRTDVMPGLGWMLHASVALELLPGWVNAMKDGGWDEYMRNPCVRKGRQCIFPEVSRTYTFGEVGNSQGMFFQQHLQGMVLNRNPVDFKHMDLGFLVQDKYDELMKSWLQAAVPLQPADVASLSAFCRPDAERRPDGPDLLVQYRSHAEFLQYARQLAPMLDDISLGGKVPRQSYKGVVVVRCRGRRLLLAPTEPPAAPDCPQG